MFQTDITPQQLTGFSASTDRQQAGESAVNADRKALTHQYEQLRKQLVSLNCADEPNMVAIDHAIDRLARLQSEIKATYGLIGNNPIGD